MCTITPAEVKDFTGSACASDMVIQLYIDSITNKIGTCLDAYDEPTCKLLFLNAVAHLTCGNQGKLTSERAPNGAAMTYQVSKTKSGLRSSQWGEQVYLMDTKGCFSRYFNDSFTIISVGEEYDAQGYLDECYNDFDDGY